MRYGKHTLCEKDLPYNQSIYVKLRGSVNKIFQDLVFICACSVCVIMPFYGSILGNLFGVEVFNGCNDWDRFNGILESSSTVTNTCTKFPTNFYTFGLSAVRALEKACGNNQTFTEEYSLSADFKFSLSLTTLLFIILVFVDVFDICSWPKTWDVQKSITFEAMVKKADRLLNSAEVGRIIAKSKETLENSNAKRKRSRTPAKKKKEIVRKTNRRSLNKVLADAAISPFETISTHCYEEMFSEPPRIIFFEEEGSGKNTLKPAFFSRTGNVYSNFIYIFASIYIILVNFKNETFLPFQTSDFIFGVLLFLLAILSIIWHGSHYNQIHVYDLASMDFCIAYCIIRIICMVPAAKMFQKILKSNIFYGIADQFAENLNDSTFAWKVSGTTCTTVCICFLLFLFWNKDVTHGDLEHSCNFSGRKRLILGEMDMFAGCLYLIMPIVYFTLPILLQMFVFKTAGSLFLSFLAASTLSIGWSYRFTERFCLDGNVLMRFAWKRFSIIDHSDFNTTKSFLRKFWDFNTSLVYGILFSPTAVLHWTTGLTLLFAYAHCKSIESEMMGE